MSDERKLAPHVARAIGAAQAKLPPAGAAAGPPGRPAPARVAPHVAAAIQACSRPGATRPPAPHLARSLAPPVQTKAAAAPARPAAHVAAAIARPGGAAQAMPRPPQRPLPPALAPALSGPVVQRSRDLQKEKKTIFDAIDEVNKSIVTTDPTKVNFFFGEVTSLQNQKVGIRQLPKKKLKLDKEQTRVSNFALSVRDRFKLPPEVQIALVHDTKKDKRYFRMSANKKKFNEKLSQSLEQSGTVEKFYSKHLRKFHIRSRRNQLFQQARTLSASELNAILEDAYKLESTDKDSFYSIVCQQIAMAAHRKNRLNEHRLRIKSARALAIHARRMLKLKVTKNTKDFHAESSILDEKKPHEKLEMVLGTKVPCIACTAFFHGKKVPEAILHHTSFGWFSFSSLSQLGFGKGEIKKYLEHLHETLGKVPDVFQHEQKDGDLTGENFTFDEPDTDSEDEDAIQGFDFDLIPKTTAKDKSMIKKIETFQNKNF